MIRVKKFFMFCSVLLSLNAFGSDAQSSFWEAVNLDKESDILVQDRVEDPNSATKYELNFAKNVDEKFLKETDDVDEFERQEKIAEQELHCLFSIGEIANEMGYEPVNTDHKNFKAHIYELMNFYNEHIQHAQYIKEHTEFNFCCGMIAYYLSDLQGIDDIRNWFESVCNMKMTQQNGIKLIENSPGENAYWFTQVLKNTTHNKF